MDFLNTADWAADGTVVHEKIETTKDVSAWLTAVGLPHADGPSDITGLHRFRSDLRAAMRGQNPLRLNLKLSRIVASEIEMRALPILDLVAISAAALLADPREMVRLKTCDGPDCGWMFIDETKNGRRKWCTMETCGNRAKAARHYQRNRKAPNVEQLT